ncbi:MAG TPA: efflux RND transporter permease subunit, partial [Anaerolineae bacterium]|nr:efflux RND transporter permease subunit [Anaerolineae bacterium]
MLKFIITRKTFISMLFLGLSLLGYISYRHLPMELIPNVEYPYLLVQVSCSQDMDPDFIEKQAIVPLEGALGTLGGISKMESSIDQRRGSIYIYYNQNVNINYAFLKLQEKIDEITSSIPDAFRVQAVKIDTERLSNMFMMLQVRGSGGLERVRSVIEKNIRKELENIDGISLVEVVGGQMESIEIVLNDEAAKAYRITPSRIRSLISQNTRQKTFVGNAYDKDKHYFVNMVADYTDVSELENLVVDPQGPVLLKNIATINFGLSQETSISRINGLNAVTVQLVRDANVNLIELSHITRTVINRLNKDLAYQDVSIDIQSDLAEEMENNINLIMKLAIAGGLMAVLILWFFLRNVRLVMVVLLAIPISILTAFNLFYAFN